MHINLTSSFAYRFTYTLDRLGLNLLDPEPLVVQPRLDPAVCNATVVCGVGGSHAVQIHLTLDSLPPEGFFPSDGVTVSLWAYDSAAWHPEGQQLLPMLLGAVEVRGGGEDHSGHVPLSYDLSIVYDLPYALASLTPTGRVAVYAAVNSLNEQQYRCGTRVV